MTIKPTTQTPINLEWVKRGGIVAFVSEDLETTLYAHCAGTTDLVFPPFFRALSNDGLEPIKYGLDAYKSIITNSKFMAKNGKKYQVRMATKNECDSIRVEYIAERYIFETLTRAKQ